MKALMSTVALYRPNRLPLFFSPPSSAKVAIAANKQALLPTPVVSCPTRRIGNEEASADRAAPAPETSAPATSRLLGLRRSSSTPAGRSIDVRDTFTEDTMRAVLVTDRRKVAFKSGRMGVRLLPPETAASTVTIDRSQTSLE
jgi:hypothetical protein